MTSPLPLPIWPGWHRMPAPLEIRWTWEAWEAAYGTPTTPHWQPWPWEDAFRQRTIQRNLDAAHVPQSIRDMFQTIKES